MNATRASLAPALSARLAPLRARWQALAPRERRMAAAAIAVVVLFFVWLVFLQPALRTLREAPARLDKLDAQLQQMQRLAAESRELRNATPPPPAQAQAALRAATEHLGEQHARLSLQGDRAVVNVTNVSGEQLRAWLAEVRSGARGRPLEAQLSHGPQGYSGTMTLAVGGPAP